MSLTKVSFAMIEGSPVNVDDYGAVGDGTTNDRAAIQAALDAGTDVWLTPGKTYGIATAIQIPSGVTLNGNGATIKALSSWSGLYMIGNKNPNTGDTNIVVENLTVDGNRSGHAVSVSAFQFSYISNCRFENNNIKNPSKHGFDCSGTSGSGGGPITDNKFIGNSITNYGTGGVGFGIGFVGDCHRNLVSNCYIQTTQPCTGVGIDDQSGPQPSNPSTYNVVEGNIIVGMEDGVLVEGSHYNTVTGNNIKDTVNRGIVLAQGLTPISPLSNTVTGNTIYPNASIGIVALGKDTTVTGNTIKAPTKGIVVGDIDPALGTNEAISLVGNVISDATGESIFVENGQGILISSNSITNGSKTGITVTSASRSIQYVTISNNSIKTVGYEGILVDGGTANTLQFISMIGNMIVDPSTASTNSYSGITLYRGSANIARISMDSNYCIDSRTGSTKMKYGIHIYAGCTAIQVGPTTVFNSTTADFSGLPGNGRSFPDGVLAGALFTDGTTAATATAGAATLPANPVGFVAVKIGGVAYKMPYYNT